MCHYAYSQFDACGHRVIEVVAFCEKALWRAAMFGKLGPCPEVAFRYQLSKAFNPHAASQERFPMAEEENHVWRGMTGFCRGCEYQYKLPRLLHGESLHDTHMSAFSSVSVVTSIHSYNGPPMPSSLNETSTEHPFVYCPYVNHSLYELLDIAEQYDVTSRSTCKVLFFPAIVFLYTTLGKWHSRAHINGVVLQEPPNRYFVHNCGLTPLDRKFIGEQIGQGKTLKQIWVMRFAQRGMYQELFLGAAAKPEVYLTKQIDTGAEGNKLLNPHSF